MKTKRFAATLAVALALLCCAVAWGDVTEPDQPKYIPGFNTPWHITEGYRPRHQVITIETRKDEGPFTNEWNLAPISDDARAPHERQHEDETASVALSTHPSNKPGMLKLRLRFRMKVPGVCEYFIRDAEGQTVMRSIHTNGLYEDFYQYAGGEGVLKAPVEGKRMLYTLEASFSPFQYQDTNFDPELIQGAFGGYPLGRGQELKREFVIENVSGDIRVRVEE